MKIKLFEELNNDYFIFEDKYLKIQLIKNGVNKGKIMFRFFNNDTKQFSDKYSMMYSAAILLDSKYERISEIRNIPIGPVLFRKVQTNTLDAIIRKFCTNAVDMILYASKFSNEIKNIPMNANNMGDIFDGLRDVRDRIKIDMDSRKYNI